MCCRAIVLKFSKKDIRKRWTTDSGNKAFILANWYRISQKQAVENNPNVQSIIDEFKEGEVKGYYWYSCKQLSKEGTCKVHESRPPICRGYPWYYGDPDPSDFLYGANCGFKIDQLTPTNTELKQAHGN
jgi:Fe-S-cluster containining protein